MVLQSGAIPYNYSFKVPWQMDHKDSPLGMSGIVWEQGAFVLADLFSRSDLAAGLYPDFFKYKTLNVAKEGFIPSNTDTELAGVDPGLSLVIDQILEYRTTLRRINTRIGIDTQDVQIIEGSALLETESNTTQRALADWLINSHPGRAPNAQAADSNDKFTRLVDVNGVEPTPGENILNMDASLLGGSGVMLDIDFGEVIYQPYPYIAGFAQVTLDNPHDGTQSAHRGVVSRPIYPAFSKTDGSVITLNSSSEDGYALNSALASGGILFRGGNIHPSSTYRVGVNADLSNVFTPQEMCTIPDSIFDDIGISNSPTLSGIVLTPPVIGTGLYKVGVENAFEQFPNTAIPSGFISAWPRNEYPSGQAYEVFDDSFWLYVLGGMMVVSPFTGRFLHLRRAEYRSDTSSTVTANIFGSGLVSPVQVGSNLICISEATSQDPSFPADQTKRRVHLSAYTTNLAFVSETTRATDTVSVGQGRQYRDATTDGSTIYAVSNSGITTFDSSLNLVDSFSVGASLVIPISYFNGKLWHPALGGLIELQLVGSGPGSVIEVLPVKTLDVSGFEMISSVASIRLGMDVNGSSTANGIWLWVVGTNAYTGESSQEFLVLATEGATTFTPVHAIHMKNLSELYLARTAEDPHNLEPSVSNFRRILHMDVD